VTISYPNGAALDASEDECLCPKGLAPHLTQTLALGGAPAMEQDTLYVFHPRGGHRHSPH